MKNTSHQLLIILLAVGSFVTGTSEFVVSGILDIIAVDLHISIPAAGQLITVYSLFYAVGALFLVMATSKLNRKKVLLSAIFVFILGNMLAFFSHHFVLLLLSRVIMAMSGGLYCRRHELCSADRPARKKGKCNGNCHHWIHRFTRTWCADWDISIRSCGLALYFSHHCTRYCLSLLASLSIAATHRGTFTSTFKAAITHSSRPKSDQRLSHDGLLDLRLHDGLCLYLSFITTDRRLFN